MCEKNVQSKNVFEREGSTNMLSRNNKVLIMGPYFWGCATQLLSEK
jgi:hypothetical protein